MPLPPFEKTDSNAELRRVWKGKYPLPAGVNQSQFTPFAPKPGGGFVGALYKKAPTKPGKAAGGAKTWLGKPGFAYRGFEKSSEIEKTRTIARRGLDAIAEKIAGDAYHAANTGRYFIPKHRLGLLPVRHAFLQPEHHTLIDFALNEMNRNRPVPITDAIHVFSKWIEGFQDLASIQTRLNGTAMPFMEAITVHGCVPETVFVDGVDVPLIGLIDILAVSRLLADSDVLGGRGDNAGIIIYRDPQGQPVVAKAVKIDPGFAFNFRGYENRFQRTRTAQSAAMGDGEEFTPEGDMLHDLKDIQFGNNHPVNIQWNSLSATQQCDFLLAMQQGDLALGEVRMIEMLLLRGGDFKLNGEDLVQEATATTLAKQWRDNIKQQRKCYEVETLRYRKELGQRQEVQKREWTDFASRLKGNPPAASAAAGVEHVPAARAIPSCFICSITQEIMIDPVITPSGRSFERVKIEEWVQRSGTDPLTRQPLRLDQLIPNRDLKEAIERFKAEQTAVAAPAPASGARSSKIATALVVAATAAAGGIFATPRAAAVINQADVNRLLLHVARGEQEEAEALAKTQPELLFHKGTVTDYSNRTFEEITALQYPLWALDWHMWTMLLKYLPKEEASAQLRKLESRGTRHEVHYDFTPLTQALDTFIVNYSTWPAYQLREHWCKVVGGAQTQVPAHVANEYCRADRSFKPTPTFKEGALPRTLKHEYGVWFPLDGGRSRLGTDFGFVKAGFKLHPSQGEVQEDARGLDGRRAYVPLRSHRELRSARGSDDVREVWAWVAELCKVRTAQLADLKRQLEPASTQRFGAS